MCRGFWRERLPLDGGLFVCRGGNTHAVCMRSGCSLCFAVRWRSSITAASSFWTGLGASTVNISSSAGVTSWFKLVAPILVRHKRCMQYLLECHLFSVTLTAMNRGCYRQFFVQGCSLCQTIWTRGLPTRDSSSITGLVLDKSFP